MSKTDDTSNLAALDDHGALADGELVAVTGGMLGLTGSGGFNLAAACVAIASTGVQDGLSNCLNVLANSLTGPAGR